MPQRSGSIFQKGNPVIRIIETSDESTTTVTGSRRRDLALFVAIALVIVGLSWRLKVYYSATAIAVEVQRIDPGGTVVQLPTPNSFDRLGAGYWQPGVIESRIRPLIDRHMRSSPWFVEAPPGARFVWIVRWSRNTTCLDQTLRIDWRESDEQ